MGAEAAKLDEFTPFQPDYFLPAQAGESSNRALGERRFIAAILEQAWLDATLPTSAKYELRRQTARKWFYRGDAGYVTLQEVCAWLRLDYPKTRRRILTGKRPQKKLLGLRGREPAMESARS